MTKDELKAYEELLRSSYQKSEQNKKGEVYIFIVSVGNYKVESKLDYCRFEADTFAKMFTSEIRVRTKNIYRLFDEKATKVNIITHLRNFKTILSEDDQLIVYFAGHGVAKSNVSFFIPYDGDRDNDVSWIPNQYISSSLSNFPSDSILFCLDLKFSGSHFLPSEKTKSISVLRHQDTLKGVDLGRTNLLGNYLAFISEVNADRIKESFIFRKYNRESYEFLHSKVHINLYYRQYYRSLLSKYYYQFLERAHNNIKSVLYDLKVLLKSNDADLFESVSVLTSKLKELEEQETNAPKEVRKEKELINAITCEVIERVKQNGFYMIHSPKIEKGIVERGKNRVKIVFTAANPRNTKYLRLKNEWNSIRYELLKSKYRHKFEIIKVDGLDIERLQDVLLNNPPNILHFSGHGNCDGIAVLNENDDVAIVKTKPLGDLFRLFSNDLECIFLNSCHSISQSHEIRKHINSVICMNKEVPDDAAISFATAFYKSLGAGKDIKFSFEFAKNAIELYDIPGSDIPVLLQDQA